MYEIELHLEHKSYHYGSAEAFREDIAKRSARIEELNARWSEQRTKNARRGKQLFIMLTVERAQLKEINEAAHKLTSQMYS